MILSKYLAEEPTSFGAWSLLRTVHWRNNEIPACREATAKVCNLNLQAGMYEAAWQDYEEFLNLGGGNMPPAVWLEICRVAEQQNDYQRALNEYQNFSPPIPLNGRALWGNLVPLESR